MKNDPVKKYTGTDTLESMSQAKYYNQWTMGKFKKYLMGNILEVGCGIGSFTKALTSNGKVYAMDIDQNLIEILKHKFPAVNAGYGDISSGQYFFNNQTFDTIVCLNVLEHIREDLKALQNMYKLLNKNGRLILLVPIYQFLYGSIDRSIDHFRRYNPVKIQRSLEQIGYTIEFKKKLNLFGSIGWFIAGRILKQKKVDARNIKIFNFCAPLAMRFEDIIEPPIGTSLLIIAQKNE